jgi:hypothetical protein
MTTTADSLDGARVRLFQLKLTDEENAARLRELNAISENDRFALSSCI